MNRRERIRYGASPGLAAGALFGGLIIAGLTPLGDIKAGDFREPLRHQDQATSLAKQSFFAFEFADLLGDSLARRADELGQIAVSKIERQNCSARIFDSELLSEFEQRDR